MKAKAVSKVIDASTPIETKPTIFPVFTDIETVNNLFPLSRSCSETGFDRLVGVN